MRVDLECPLEREIKFSDNFFFIFFQQQIKVLDTFEIPLNVYV